MPTPPSKAIEVADSSLPTDRDTKLSTYALNRGREYWIVNLRARCVDVHTRPVGRIYELVRRFEHGQLLHPQCFPDVEIVVSDVIR